MLRARSPTTGKRSWVDLTSRSRRSRAGPARLLGRRGLGDPALEQLGRQADVGGGALLGQEDAEHRLLELRGPVEVGDAVVGEHPGQPVAELVGQPAAVDVEALQVGVEVLLRAVHAQLGVQVLPAGPVAAELGEVGEEAEQLDLVGHHVAAGRHELVAGGEVVGDHVAVLARVDVEAHQHRGDVVAGCGRRAPGGGGRDAGRRQVEGRRRSRRRAASLRGVVLDGLETHQRGAGLDLAARSAPAARGPGPRTARAAPSPSSCSPAPAPARRPRPRRRPRPARRRPARGPASAARRPRRG